MKESEDDEVSIDVEDRFMFFCSMELRDDMSEKENWKNDLFLFVNTHRQYYTYIQLSTVRKTVCLRNSLHVV